MLFRSLKDAIKDFDGTVIVVSHDREFLDGLVEKVYEFGGGKVKENLGGIYEFLNKKRLENLSDLERKDISLSSGAASITTSGTVDEATCDEGLQPRQLSYAEQKEREKTLRKAEKALKASEEAIADLENRQAELERRLASGDASDEVLREYSEVSSCLDKEMEVWEEAQRDRKSVV